MHIPRERPVLEDLSLHQVLEHWINIVLLTGERRTLQQMVDADLSFPETVVLRMLRHGSLNVADVAAAIAITQSTASRVVDRLVHAGFVTRQENPEDRRQKQISLTPEGEKLLERLEEAFLAALEPSTSTLTFEEQEQFRLLLAKMIAAQSDDCFLDAARTA